MTFKIVNFKLGSIFVQESTINFVIKEKKRFSVKLAFLMCLMSFNLFAQLKYFKKGLTDFQAGFYDLAINEFKKVQQIEDTQKGVLNLKIAESYQKTNRTLLSIPYYEKAFELGINDANALYHYGYALKANEEYEKAKLIFEKYLQLQTSNKALNDKAQNELTNLQLIADLKTRKSDLKFRNFEEVNTAGSEFGAIHQNGFLVYTASRKAKKYANGLPYLGLYQFKVNDSLEVSDKESLFSNAINDLDRNDGSPSFSPDGKTMIFARGNSGKRKELSSDVDLYISRFQPQSGWSEPVLVSASDSVAWDGSPAFSHDGKSIYFGSNRAGGSGGIDLYKVNMDASGRFGNAVNMGKTINTPGDEMFPFVSQEGKLYFASDGHAGLGKLDLFVAVRQDGKTTVENLGLPFNSNLDDFALSIDDAGNMFFSSNRAGGKGDDDIYVYKAPAAKIEVPIVNIDTKTKDKKVVNYFLKGDVFVNNDGKIIHCDSVLVKVFKQETDNVQIISEIATADGKFGPIPLEESTDYYLSFEKTNYLTKREGFSMYGRAIPNVLLKKPVTDTTFYLKSTLDKIFVGKTFKIDNIYYDFDKFDIRSDAGVELDKLVQILNDNPKISIELDSHTDSQGSDIYNLRLSQRRAESVVKYLLLKGISKDRMSAKGYGESELLIENAKTDAEHQQNRRTEFKIVDIAN